MCESKFTKEQNLLLLVADFLVLCFYICSYLKGFPFFVRFFYAISLIRTVSYIFLSVRSAGGTFVDWYKSTQKIAFEYAAFGERILICGGKSKYHPPMRLRSGSSLLTFQPEKIRLNTKLSVKIVRKQVYERTKSSFACCGFFGSVLLYLLLLEGFSFLRPFLLCCRFDSYRVLYLSIRPLRWGHFCRLKQKYPKVRFWVRRIWKPNFPFAGEKGKYRLPMRLQRFRLLISLFKNTNPLLSLNHTLSWFSVRES